MHKVIFWFFVIVAGGVILWFVNSLVQAQAGAAPSGTVPMGPVGSSQTGLSANLSILNL
jgi:hypothetical protein